jgi:hypothetical protein
LASEAASMITGSSIIIDGGWTAKWNFWFYLLLSFLNFNY